MAGKGEKKEGVVVKGRETVFGGWITKPAASRAYGTPGTGRRRQAVASGNAHRTGDLGLYLIQVVL